MNLVLLDTGPLVALLDRSEPDHDRVQKFMARLRGSRLVTTGAVITKVAGKAVGAVTDLQSILSATPAEQCSVQLANSSDPVATAVKD